jgi:threonine dehydratase
MGAFKMRGAINAILQIPSSDQAKGVVTHSSGNFAQAVSLAAKNLGIPAHIVMPTNAPQVKKDAVISYKGIIYESEPTIAARQALASQIQDKTGATFLHPSNHMDVILGQGTAAIELLQQQPSLHSIITPVGGGGLLAGSALAAKYYGSSVSVYGGEPLNADDAYRSLQSGEIQYNTQVQTIADGLRTHLGDTNFPIIKTLVTDIIRVEEQEIIAAMKLLWERLKIIIEPSCAVAFAALLKDKKTFAGKKVGIILSGGNVDLTSLPF